MLARDVALGQPNRVALFAPDRDFVARQRDHRGGAFVIGNDEPNHFLGASAETGQRWRFRMLRTALVLSNGTRPEERAPRDTTVCDLSRDTIRRYPIPRPAPRKAR